MPHIIVSASDQHWFREWLAAYSAPSHYLNQCWVLVNWTLRNKFQWSFNQNTQLLLIHEVHLDISSVKWRPFCPGGDEIYNFMATLQLYSNCIRPMYWLFHRVSGQFFMMLWFCKYVTIIQLDAQRDAERIPVISIGLYRQFIMT